MKLRGIKPMEGEHVNVTPLIDVVMCLIIFFLLVGHIAKKASVKGIRIPSTVTGKSLGDQSNQLIINLVPRHSEVQGIQRRPRIYIWDITTPTTISPASFANIKHTIPLLSSLFVRICTQTINIWHRCSLPVPKRKLSAFTS